LIYLFSKRIIGIAIDSKMNADLLIKALYEAIGRRSITFGVILHSDLGSQYRSEIFQDRLALYGITASMSARGNCYDNSMVESFFGTLKTELDWNQKFTTREQAKASIFEYIECWYNNKRLHSSLGYLSPSEFEAKYYKNSSYDFV
jgi:putative transposase